MAGLALGVDHSKKVIEDLGNLVMDVIVVGKKVLLAMAAGLNPLALLGAVAGSIRDMVVLYEDAKDLILELPQALPEAKDLTAQEMGELGSAIYEQVTRVVHSFVPKAA